MTWVSLVFIPPTALVTMGWLFNLQARRFFRAWALSYVAQGMAVVAAVIYLAGGDLPDGVSALIAAAGFLAFRRIFTTEGPRKWWFLPEGR